MASIIKINASKGITVNIGHFESIRIDCGVEVQSDGEDEDTLFEIAYESIDKVINDKISEIQDIVDNTSSFKIQEDIKNIKKHSHSRRRRK